MKKKVFASILLISLLMLVLPAANILSDKTRIADLDPEKLYNTDVLMSVVGIFYYHLGISIDPEQVLVGKNEWLFLGDMYGSSITKKRAPISEEDKITSEKVLLAAKAWDNWFQQHGAKKYLIMIVPDKDTMYSENLPDWAKPISNPTFNTLPINQDNAIYVDTLSALRNGKEKYDVPLYYRTDHHWNSLGGWIAFDEFAKKLSSTQPELVFPTNESLEKPKVAAWAGGDLSKFQRIREILVDQQVVMDKFSYIEINQYDFWSDQLLSQGPNIELGAPSEPTLVKSKSALNQKKVLWLRDSFGSIMSPFMMATFSEVLQLHYGVASNEFLEKMYSKFNPDYVFITVVERNARIDYFQALPPLFTASEKSNFLLHANGEVIAMKDMGLDEKQNYSVSGGDPYLVLRMSKPIYPMKHSSLSINMHCNNDNQQLPVQIFWKSNNEEFSEERSVRVVASQGDTSIELSSSTLWNDARDITEMRLDLETDTKCSEIFIKKF